jgi:uncharacterized protein (TIGR02646 family)
VIRVPFRSTPASLDGATSAGGIEAAKAAEFYANAGNRNKNFDFKAYKAPDVTKALGDEFEGKCAYCEAKWQGTQPLDAEHFRPKGGYVVAGALVKPGYFWLAASWENLLPSCTDCNRQRYQEFADEPEHLAGKANLFPIRDEARRATAPGMEKGEGRLLLHPRLDDPERHLDFGDEGIVVAKADRSGRVSAKGKASIDVYGLKREGLRRLRRDRRIEILGAIEHVRVAAMRVRRRPTDDLDRYDLASHVAALRRMTLDSAPFAAMARQLAAPVLSKIEKEFGPQDPNPTPPADG